MYLYYILELSVTFLHDLYIENRLERNISKLKYEMGKN